MRKDFDYVLMDDYSKDMADLRVTAVNCIDKLKLENERLQELLQRVIIAAGGEVRVSVPSMESDLKGDFSIEKDHCRNEIVYKVTQ